MTSTVSVLLKELRKKRIVSANLEKESESVICESISFEKPSDLHVRDALFGLGTILKEDLDKHFYITSVKTGVFNNVLAYAIIQRNEDKTVDVAVYAKEGLIKQNLAGKAMEKIKVALNK